MTRILLLVGEEWNAFLSHCISLVRSSRDNVLITLARNRYVQQNTSYFLQPASTEIR